MTTLADLKVKIFADGADKQVMLEMNAQPHIRGLTTNPTLMAKAGIRDYEAFARDVLEHITEKPLSLEVFSDDIDEMEREALKVASWAENVYVKIPVSNTKGESTCGLVRRLADTQPGTGSAVLHFRLRRAHRRYRHRSVACDVRRGRTRGNATTGRGDLGEPARAAKHRPG